MAMPHRHLRCLMRVWTSKKALAVSFILSGSLSGCAGRATNTEDRQPDNVDAGPAAGASGNESSTQHSGSCVPLSIPRTEGTNDDVGIEFACGSRSVSVLSRSDYLSSGQICGGSGGINTFALRPTGRAAADYSAVARCGYIRYDNGTFVGERVEVEARDGEWCDDQALKRLELADRMLLTDVSFALEAKNASVPKRQLALAISTLAGWTKPEPAESNLCVYVANRQAGASTCSMAPATDSCVCPCDAAWQDFITGVRLSLVQP